MYKGRFEAGADRSRPRVDRKPEAQSETRSEKKTTGPKRHTVVFYSVYAACILAFFVGIFALMGELDQFLVKYEASQPDVKSQEVFSQLFSQPDWEKLYDMAEPKDTAYDGKESFVAYMQQKVGQSELSFVETSMGLSKDKKFFVRLGEENIGAFSLTNVADAVAIPEWELADVELYTTYACDVTVHSYPGFTVSVNGVALGEEQIIRTTQTLAEQYLPEGLRGARSVTYYLDGLLVPPTVTITDEAGAEMTLSYDETANAYSHTLAGAAVTDELRKAFQTASEAYGKFMIADLSKNRLAKYFTGNSYNAIIQAELAWMQNFSSYRFSELELTEFYAYSDSFCSARVHQTLYVTRGNGTVKEYEINSTFFMEKHTKGWMVVEMTNANVQSGKSQVRLTYVHNGTVLQTGMVDAESATLIPPAVEAPNGKVFAGWFRQTVNEAGEPMYTRMFLPDEDGKVSVPAGYELEPMVLYALFESGRDKAQ